ncbi:MAG: HAMP domain-containing histidine kinase [Deltaproteobacteria bacterium]|nr:HAMP domain-containing histidine kinase [Deltaproteobacteria bacterium]MBW2445143.1 HAMP domain-containing histidine kinase [Deltaproteobacteria bacterium]
MNDATRQTAPTGTPDLSQGIAQGARAAASRSVEIVGGGLALLFARTDASDSAPPPLRAAAGFPTPTSARQAAEALQAVLRDLLERRAATTYAPVDSLGVRGAGGVVGIPLCLGDRWHGALIVAAPAAVGDPAVQALAHVAEIVAIRLDHAQLAGQLNALNGVADQKEAKSDEILKLSEALFAQDIELRRSSEQLGKIEKLKNDFIEKMSRELRAPLNNIIEAIISVLASETDSLSEESRLGLRGALDEGTGFLRTLQNILDLWRIKQGELPVEAQDVNFREVVEEVTFSVQDAFEGKPVVIERNLDEPFPKIRTDLAKLHQILYLLLDNAAKFTPKGRIEIEGSVADGRLQCSIRDTGIGIAPDDKDAVFDEFFQVDDASSSRYRGAGLGLALVRDLVTLLDGSLTLQSEIGEGTTVTVSLPVHTLG